MGNVVRSISNTQNMYLPLRTFMLFFVLVALQRWFSSFLVPQLKSDFFGVFSKRGMSPVDSAVATDYMTSFWQTLELRFDTLQRR